MDTKDQIIAYATTLLKQKGYYGWSYDHISKKIGIKKASVHYYFPSKESLVLSVLQIYIRAVFAKLKAVSKSHLSNFEKLEQLFNIYRENYENEDEICLCTILASDYQTLSPELSQCLLDFNNELNQWLFKVFQEGVKAKEFRKNLSCIAAAYMVSSTLQGLLLTSKLSKDHQIFQSCVEQIFIYLKTERA